jgi:hypothetical protein
MRSAARGGPASSVSPVLSEELRRRLHTVVKAERKAPEAEKTEKPDNSFADAGRRKRPAKASNATRTMPTQGTTRVLSAAESQKRSSASPEPPMPPGAGAPRGRRPIARLLGLALAVVIVGSAAVLVIRHLNSGNAASTAWLQQEPAVRDEAAAWVSQQVSFAAKVGCDRTMCTSLSQAGFPSGQLVVLGATSPGLPSAQVMVVTPAIRSMFGSSIDTADAPAVLASFGTGAAQIDVRITAPNGVVAYRAELSEDQQQQKETDATLVGVPGITVSPTARRQLNDGLVDSRLVLAIAQVASTYSVTLVDFGNVGTGGSPGVALRYADIAENLPASQLQGLRASLARLTGDIRPARTQDVTLASGQTVLRVEFTAPSPLGTASLGSP